MTDNSSQKKLNIINENFIEITNKTQCVIKDVTNCDLLSSEYQFSVLNYIRNVVVYIENLILKLDKLDKLEISEKKVRKNYIVQMQNSLKHYDLFVTSLELGNVTLNIKQIASLLVTQKT